MLWEGGGGRERVEEGKEGSMEAGARRKYIDIIILFWHYAAFSAYNAYIFI